MADTCSIGITAEDFAFSKLLSYAAYNWPSYQIGDHHRQIAEHLEAVERGDIKRLMITMPPRHGKSMLASEFFPAWYLGRNPEHYVIAASYAQELADDFGRKVRNQMAGEEFAAIFPGVSLAQDSTSAKRFNTESGGAYFAVGVGGPVTGRGAHLLLIDDPVKNREDADSEIQRKKAKEWYTSTAYTRLMPGGRIVVIQCMTGDTKVLMADGGEKNLRNVLVGDEVATFSDGELKKAKVIKWANNGVDSVLRVRTKTGRTVKANSRHPFLVLQDGELRWIKTRDLRQGQKIVRVSGGSGRENFAYGMVARARQGAAAIVRRIITKKDGLMESARHLPTAGLSRELAQNSNTGMELFSKITEGYCASKAVGVQFASAHLKTPGTQRTGTPCFVSTIAMIRGRFAGFYAMIATLLLGEGKRQKYLNQQHLTSDFTLDEIVSIEDAGEEEVFDVQIYGTENFIANGLVSHNTRWHEDDLAGWLLAEQKHEGWVVLNLPAIKDGNALWPEQYPLERLQQIKATIGPRDWSALYQQEPTPDSGEYFKREWIRHYENKPEHLQIYGASDYAVTEDDGDYTVHGVMGIDKHDNIYLLDWWRGRTDSAKWVNVLIQMIQRWSPVEWAEEQGQIAKSLAPFIDKRMQETNTYCYRKQYPSAHDKATRAQAIRGRISQGRVFFPKKEWADDLVLEMLVFPNGKHDDQVDVLSLMGRMIKNPKASEWDKPLEINTGYVV